MINSITRASLFRSSVFADNLIAGMQQSYASDFDATVKSEALVLKKLYDHRKPFKNIEQSINGHCVLAYPANNKKDYTRQLPTRLISFLQLLEISELYLLDFLSGDIAQQFPFESFSKRNQWKRLVATKGCNIAYHFSIVQLQQVLPPFFFSDRHSAPGIYLINKNGKTDIAMDLCDDGNLHVSYQKTNEQAILDAAQKSGLQTGDTQLCTQYSICYLH